MSKERKTPHRAPAAPAAAPAEKKVDVLDLTNFNNNLKSAYVEGLDPNRRVDLLRILHETFRMDPDAAEKYHMSPETVAKINEVSAIGQVAALASEICHAKNDFAVRMSIGQLETIKEVCAVVGVSIDTKALPAPGKDGTVQIPSTAISVSKEAQEKIEEEENIINEQVETDPTKIEDEEQLIKALKNIMVTRPNVFQKVKDALNFYEAYLKVKASKAENKKEALKEINEKSRTEMLKEMADLIGACPLVLNGVGRYMHNVTATSGSPIAAFCMFRNSTKNRKTGAYAITDEEVADYVRTIVEWTNSVKVADETKRLESLKENLAILKKDEKKNAKGIKDTEEKIKIAESNLNHFSEVISYLLDPSSEIPSKLMEDYNDKNSDRHAVAIRTVNAIGDSYYDEVNLKEMKQDIVRHNIEQYAGIVINLFRDPNAQLDQYSKSNLIDLEPIPSSEEPEEKPAEKEKPAEEPKKE